MYMKTVSLIHLRRKLRRNRRRGWRRSWRRRCPSLTDGRQAVEEGERKGERWRRERERGLGNILTTQSLICWKNECQLKFFNEITFFDFAREREKATGSGGGKEGRHLSFSCRNSIKKGWLVRNYSGKRLKYASLPKNRRGKCKENQGKFPKKKSTSGDSAAETFN